jgi:hypothetical protein
MGYDTKKQLPLQLKAIVKMLELVRQDLDEREAAESALLLRFGALVAILTAGSLRGHEGFYLDIAATKAHLEDGKQGVLPEKFSKQRILSEDEVLALPTVCICLMGKFKGETGERYHSIILANETMSGLTTRWWVESLMALCDSEGRTKGFAFDEVKDTPPQNRRSTMLYFDSICRGCKSAIRICSQQEKM